MAEKYISVEGAKKILHDLAMESALNNVGYICDASEVFQSCAERLQTWLDLVPGVLIENAKAMKTIPEETLYYAGADYEEFVKSELVQLLANHLFQDHCITIEKMENKKTATVSFIGKIKVVFDEKLEVKK